MRVFCFARESEGISVGASVTECELFTRRAASNFRLNWFPDEFRQTRNFQKNSRKFPRIYEKSRDTPVKVFLLNGSTRSSIK